MSANWKRCGWVLLLGTAAAFAGQGQPEEVAVNSKGYPATPLRPVLVDAEYEITPDDVLEITVLDVPELSRVYQVTPAGYLQVPLLPEPLAVAGLTLAQAADKMGRQLRDNALVSRPQVSIVVKQSRLHAVAITGAVKRPQVYPVLGPTSLLEVLSQAEGLAVDAGNIAIISRGTIAQRMMNSRPGDNSHQVTVDLQKLLGEGHSDLDVSVYPGDRVTVPRAGIVYVVGAVNRPGGFPLNGERDNMTVLQALALAEDLKITAQRSKAVIIRRDSPQQEKIHIDLSKLLAAKAPDPNLRANDILFIPDSSSRRAIHRGLEAAIQAATGVAIYRQY